MRIHTVLATVLVLGALGPDPILAQAPAPGSAGAGTAGGAPSTDPTATGGVGPGGRDIAATGQTKPPGTALGPRDDTTRALDDKAKSLTTGICRGCE